MERKTGTTTIFTNNVSKVEGGVPTNIQNVSAAHESQNRRQAWRSSATYVHTVPYARINMNSVNFYRDLLVGQSADRGLDQ
jgi:hypothetical protein